MNPSIVQQAQQQAQGNFNNDFGSTGIGDMASAGSTIDQAKQALQDSADAGQSVRPTTPQQSSLVSRLLPTGAGILGAIVSGGLDLGTGGLATALDPAIVGAFTAAGRAGENALTGQKVLQGNDLTAGAEGAIGQGVGNVISKGLGAAGGGLIKAGENQAGAATDATDAATQQATADAAQKMYAQVPKGLRQAHNLTGSLDLANNLGIDATNPQNLVDAGGQANGILDSNLNDALGNAGPVDTSNYYQMVKDAIGGQKQLGSLDPVAISRGKFGLPKNPASDLLESMRQIGEGTVGPTSDPTAVRGLLQNVGKQLADEKPGVTALTGAKDPVQVARFNALGDIYNNLKDTLYNRPEVASNISDLEGNIQAGDVGGNQALADNLNGVLGGATNHQPVLDALQQFGNLRSTGQDALTAGKGIVPALGEAAPAGGRGIINGTNGIDLAGGAEALLGHHPALGLGMVAANHLAQSPTALKGAGGILSGIGASMAPNIAGITAATSPNDVAPPAGPSNGIQLPQMNQGNSILDQALYEAMQNPLNGGLSQVGSLLPMVQKANQAQAAEQSLTGDFNQAGGAQGPLGGILSRLGATLTGGEAASYPAQAAAEAQTIANATGVPAQQIQAELPKTTQGQSAAQASIGNVNSLIQALLLQQGQGGAGSTGSPSGGLLGAVY